MVCILKRTFQLVRLNKSSFSQLETRLFQIVLFGVKPHLINEVSHLYIN